MRSSSCSPSACTIRSTARRPASRAQRGRGRPLRTDARRERCRVAGADTAWRSRAAARSADRRADRGIGAGRRSGGMALPHRRGLGKRRYPGRVELSAPPPGRREGIRLLPPPVRATVGPAERIWTIPPSIDPFSPKNQHLDDDTVRAILARIGVLDGAAPDGRASFSRSDGGAGVVIRVRGDHRRRPPRPR